MEIFDKILSAYSDNGNFVFNLNDDLKSVCQAPDDKCGIYLFYKLSEHEEQLLYIGCSGHIKNNGSINVRKSGCGGIKGRIVNGKQFDGRQRWKSLPAKMLTDNVTTIEIYWYATCTNHIKHSPLFVESTLLQAYYDNYNRLPKWNLKF